MTETIKNVSWVEDTERAVALARDADKAQKQAELLSDLESDLGRRLSEFESLRDSAVVVTGLGWKGKPPPPDLLQNLKDASATLDSRPLKLAERALGDFRREVADALQQCWRNHAERQLGDVADLLQLSETLSDVEGVGEVSQDLAETLRQLERSRDSLPSSESAGLLSTAEQLLGQLESALQPDGVRRFLSAVARGGASVENLTPEVMKWLEGHESVNRFRIVAGQPVEGPSD